MAENVTAGKKRWTVTEDALLTCLWARGIHAVSIAERLDGRSAQAVRARLNDLDAPHRASRDLLRVGSAAEHEAIRQAERDHLDARIQGRRPRIHGITVRDCLGDCPHRIISTHPGHRYCSRCRDAAAATTPRFAEAV